jgi:hypothetical protein
MSRIGSSALGDLTERGFARGIQIMQLSSIRFPTEHIAVQKSSCARDNIEGTVVLIHRVLQFLYFLKR